jgi:hypothetical protein
VYFNNCFKEIQATFGATCQLSALTRRAHGTHLVIEEIVEGFVEGFAPAIFLERNSQVRFHKPMITAGLEKPPMHGSVQSWSYINT